MILTFLHKISVRVSTLCMRNGWLHAAIMLVWLTVCTVATAQDAQRPLAYIRRLAVAPAVLATLPAEAPKPAPKGASRAEREAWDRREAARQGLARLRSASAAILTSALVERLRGEPGLAIARIEGNETARRLWRHAEEGASPPGEPEIGRDPSGLILPASDQVIAAMRRVEAVDGLLFTAVEEFGVSGGLERTVWIRCIAYLARVDTGQIHGPYDAAGWARAFRKLVGKGYQRPDEDLLAAAARSAARQLVHTLLTGESSPFAFPHRVAVLPAELPDAIPKMLAGGAEISRKLPALRRQADVLLQPDAGPVVKLMPATVTDNLLTDIRPDGARLWTADGDPDVIAIASIANELRAAYVFVSKVTDVRLSERPIVAMDGAARRDGLEREIVLQAEAAFVRARDGAVLWRDTGAAHFVSRTEYFRGRARLLTDEQLVVDAARAAFGQLRTRFEEYRRRFEK
jgi:hypothetical protein